MQAGRGGSGVSVLEAFEAPIVPVRLRPTYALGLLVVSGVMIAMPLLLYFPPGEPGSAANGLFLATVLSLYFISFTVYVAPYL